MWGTDVGLQILESACNLRPTGTAATSEQRYLIDSNILSNIPRWHGYACKRSGDWAKFGTFVNDPQQPISPTAERQRKQSKNMPAWNQDSREGFRQRLHEMGGERLDHYEAEFLEDGGSHGQLRSLPEA